jgi:hypothetical protein
MTSNAVLVGYFCDITGRERPEATVMLSEIGCSRVFEDTQSSSDTSSERPLQRFALATRCSSRNLIRWA